MSKHRNPKRICKSRFNKLHELRVFQAKLAQFEDEQKCRLEEEAIPKAQPYVPPSAIVVGAGTDSKLAQLVIASTILRGCWI